MSNLYIHNGSEWCDICSNKAKVRVPSGDWIQINGGIGVNKYYNGEEWVVLDCCYEIIAAPPIPSLPPIPSNIETSPVETPLALQVMSFLDDPAYIPTCKELKYDIACVDGYPSHGDAGNVYRFKRDAVYKYNNYNGLAEYAGDLVHTPLDYTTWEPGGLSDDLIYVKGGLMNYRWLWGCPECTYLKWYDVKQRTISQVLELGVHIPEPIYVDGVYENIEFNTISTSNVSGPGKYLTANITVESNLITNIQVVNKGSGYALNEKLGLIPGQIPNIVDTSIPFPLPEVTIGNQIWTSSNLNVTTYRNGDIIPQVTDPIEWANLTTGAWCYYNNDPSTEATYGKLYNWYAIDDSRGLAPIGWHVPTDYECIELMIYLGGPSVAGGKMKEVGTTHWHSPNTGATNSSGFTALPGGYRYTDGGFYNIGDNGLWWSSTQTGDDNALCFTLYNSISNFSQSVNSRKQGQSVRLVKGNEPTSFKVIQLKENTIADLLPTVTGGLNRLDIRCYPDTFPGPGNPGDIFKYIDEFGQQPYYAWDPNMNIWSERLGECIVDVSSERSGRRDASLKALNELLLANPPFLNANDHLPFHRWRNEVM